jgi:hypothetical protein
MPEEAEKQQMVAELKEKMNKQGTVDTEKVIVQVATRDKLERDYKEDLLDVQFYSSPETKRMIKAKRPTQKQMISIMRLSAEAALYEGKMDAKSLQKMVEIYDGLNLLAAELCVDKSLDKEFWANKVSFTTLQSFITELIKKSQQGPITESELKTFR